jgi:hypothetical protein
MATMNRRPRHLAGPIAAAAVVVLLVAVLLVVGAGVKHHRSSGRSATTTSTAARGALPAPSPGGGTTRSGQGAGATPASPGHGTTRTTTPATTTLPTQYVAVTSTAHSATYTAPGPSYTVGVGATTGNCWVQVTETSSGTSPFARTLNPGEQQAVAVQGEVTVVIGAPSVGVITLDGAPVVFPSGAQAPLDLSITPPATTASSGPSK